MLEISPVSNFLAIRSSWALVSLNGVQRGIESGRKPEREGSSCHSSSLGDLDRRPPQHLGVELVGAALDLLRDLEEQRDQLVAIDREAVASRPPS